MQFETNTDDDILQARDNITLGDTQAIYGWIAGPFRT